MRIAVREVEVLLPGSSESLFHIKEFGVPEGGHVLILGESGKGKTTLLHILAGLLMPDQGTVRVGEWNLTRMSDAERTYLRRKYFGLLFQRFNLIDHLTAEENVLLGIPDPFSGSASRALEALDRVGLRNLSNRPAAYLSPGEQQRVVVARIWAAQPRIILVDEPTSSLDGKNADKILELLLETSRGKTLIMVSHDSRTRKYMDEILDFDTMIKR